MGIVGSVVASIEALTNERDKANEMVIELVDILQAALIDRLTVDHDTETATNIWLAVSNCQHGIQSRCLRQWHNSRIKQGRTIAGSTGPVASVAVNDPMRW
ncbi:hypothetical protein [Mesorhizobium sp. A623]